MHAEKYTRAATGHMLAHYERGKDENGIPVTLHRENVDERRSYLNYNLAPSGAAQSRLEAILQRDDVKCLNRSDVNVLADVVVTAPKGLLEQDKKRFFSETYNFLCNRYGCTDKDGKPFNVVSAWVHRDETSDHMHFAFVPLQKTKKFDKKQQKEISFYKVNAKQVINRKDLQTLHPDMSARMKKVFGRDIGIENGATKGGNKTVEQLKYKSQLDNEIAELKYEVAELQENYEYNKRISDSLSEQLVSQKNAIEERNAELAKVETYSELGRVLIEKETQLKEAENDLRYIQRCNEYRACNEVIKKWNIEVPVYMSEQNNDKLNEGIFQTIIAFLKEVIQEIKEVFSKLLGEDFEQKQQEIKTEIEQDYPTSDKNFNWEPDITDGFFG